MNGERSITNADEPKLIKLIGGARRRVLYLGPGLTENIAAALADAWSRLEPPQSVTVILDVDPEVCRLGYGTIEGLKKAREAAAKYNCLVCHKPGLRIGLLVADDTTLVYSPTPLLIEAGSKTPEHPNAIQLEALPQKIAKEIGLGGNPNIERMEGLDPVEISKIQEVEDDLKNSPAAKFDLARRVRVFTSQFQFVELEMTGCFISRKKVPIPSNLMGLARDTAIQSQFHAHFNLVNQAKLKVITPEKRTLTETTLREAKQKIAKDFLVSLKGYGTVVRRSRKEEFQKMTDNLRADVEAFQKGVTKNLQKHMDNNAGTLVQALLPAVKQNPPASYTKIYGTELKKVQVKTLLEADIKEAFGKAKWLVQEMNVKVVFKDVAYESLVDEEFLKIARREMPGLQFLHQEHEVAEAKPSGQKI